MVACGSIGTFARMLVQGGGTRPRTFSSSSERTEFVYESLGTERNIQSAGRITGTRSAYIGATREKAYLVKGSIAMQPSPTQLGLWLPRIFGGTPVGTDYPLANSLPEFDVIIDREGDVFTYQNMQVAQAVLRGQSSEGGDGIDIVDLIVVLVGTAEIPGSTYPVSLPPELDDTLNRPYALFDGTLELDGTELSFDKFNLMVDNGLLVKFRNSLTPQCIRATTRTVRLETENPFNSETITKALDFYNDVYSGTLSFALGDATTTFEFPALKNEFKTPTVQGRNEIPLNLQLQAYRTSTDPEIVITHDLGA